MKIALLLPDAYVRTHAYFRPYLTPGAEDFWKGAQFVVNPDDGIFDGVVVHQSTLPLDRPYRLRCPPSRTLLAVKEPPDVLFLPDGFTRQFHTVLGQDPRVQCRRRLIAQSGHHWFVEIPITEARARPIVEKPKLLSAVVSAKTDTAGHRKRLRFMEVAQRHFGERLDWFGRGVREIGDHKLTGLSDYRYHLVLENGAWPHYWTEKVADAFVANCFPFYWGAPNLADYFGSGAFMPINPSDPAGAIAGMEAAITEDRWTQAQPQLAEARENVLDRYHPYETYLDILGRQPTEPARALIIRPHTEFHYTLGARIRHRLWRWKHRSKLQ